jgi:hypothetical protein
MRRSTILANTTLPEWFESKTKEGKKEYLEKHPNSKIAKIVQAEKSVKQSKRSKTSKPSKTSEIKNLVLTSSVKKNVPKDHVKLVESALEKTNKILNSWKIKPKDDLNGLCAALSVSLWNDLGKPKDLVPVSVMCGDEEHVLLYNTKEKWAIDPAGEQFVGNDARFFVKDPKEFYNKFKRLTTSELKGVEPEIKGLEDKSSGKKPEKKKSDMDYWY